MKTAPFVYRAPCYTDGTSGAECGRANVPTTSNIYEVRCEACREMLAGELALSLPSLAPHHSPAEHAKAAARIVAEIGGGE